MPPPPSTAAESSIVRLPKGMVFPVNPRGPVRIQGLRDNGEEITIDIGGVSPLGGSPDLRTPALCFSHYRIILKILAGTPFDAPEVPVNYTALCAAGKGRALNRRLLTQLGATWIHVMRPGKPVLTDRLLAYNPEVFYHDGVDQLDAAAREVDANIRFRRLRHVRFNEHFFLLASNWANCWDVRVDIVDRIYSDTAAACYLLLAAKSYRKGCSEADPNLCFADELLAEVGAEVPTYPSQLRRVFEGRRYGFSLLEQLDGQDTWTGKLRVSPTLLANREGRLMLRYWRDTDGAEAGPAAGGAQWKAWVEAGLPAAEFTALTQGRNSTLMEAHVESLKELGYEVQGNRRSLEMMCGILGYREFECAIGELKRTLKEKPGHVREVGKFFGGILRDYFRDEIARRVRARRR